MARTSFNDDWSYRTPLSAFAALSGEDAAPTAVRLPHDALRDAERAADVPSRGASAYYPTGAYTYLKTFDVPAQWAGKVVRLEIEGAYRHAMVFLNDELAGHRADGYARFFVDLTPYLRFGDTNTLRIEVRSGQDSRWYSGAGLHRPVYLHVDDPVHIGLDGVRVSTVRLEDDQAVIEVATSVVNRGLTTAALTVTTSVTDPQGTHAEGDATPLTLAPGRTAVVRQRLYLPDPHLWSVDTPSLYVARTGLGDAARGRAHDLRRPHGHRRPAPGATDQRRERAAARRMHPQRQRPARGRRRSPGQRRGASSCSRLRASTRSAPRTTRPLPRCWTRATALGMLVMDEAFDMWTRGKTPYDYALDFPQWWAADLESMVAKDYNHPSVIMYSLGNEIVEVGTPHGAALAREMAEHVRSLDPTRPITNGINAALAVLDDLPAVLASERGLNELMADIGEGMRAIGSSEAVTRRTAESSSVLDVLGLNYADGRYATDAALFPHRVIVGSETFPSQIGTLWPLVQAHPHVIGDFTWTGWDYLGEVGIGATAYHEDPDAVPELEREYPYLTAWCGDLDITGWRRPVSYYREIVFGLRTEPVIAVLRPERHGHTVSMQSPWAWSDSVSLMDLARLRRQAGDRRGLRGRRRGRPPAGRDRGGARTRRRAAPDARLARDRLPPG